MGQTDNGVGPRWYLSGGQVGKQDRCRTRCDTDGVHVTAMFTVVPVQLPVRKVSVMGIQRMAKFLLMGSCVTVWISVDDKISRALNAHEEEGYNNELASEGPHLFSLLRIAQERSG